MCGWGKTKTNFTQFVILGPSEFITSSRSNKMVLQEVCNGNEEAVAQLRKAVLMQILKEL